VDALLKAGADVNGSRVTALLIASRFGHASAVVKLMHAGADVTAVDDDGNTGEFIWLFFGYFWLFLVIFGYFWLFLVIFGYLCMGNSYDVVFYLQRFIDAPSKPRRRRCTAARLGRWCPRSSPRALTSRRLTPNASRRWNWRTTASRTGHPSGRSCGAARRLKCSRLPRI
jgi:hypothetical protein